MITDGTEGGRRSPGSERPSRGRAARAARPGGGLLLLRPGDAGHSTEQLAGAGDVGGAVAVGEQGWAQVQNIRRDPFEQPWAKSRSPCCPSAAHWPPRVPRTSNRRARIGAPGTIRAGSTVAQYHECARAGAGTIRSRCTTKHGRLAIHRESSKSPSPRCSLRVREFPESGIRLPSLPEPQYDPMVAQSLTSLTTPRAHPFYVI
jgi:hypothetical protein